MSKRKRNKTISDEELDRKDAVWMFVCAGILIGAWALDLFTIGDNYSSTDESIIIEIEDKGTNTTILNTNNYTTKYYFYWNDGEDSIEVSRLVYNSLEVGDLITIEKDKINVNK